MKKFQFHLAAAITSIAAILSTQSAQASIIWEDFDSGIPGTWVVIDNESDGVFWDNIAGAGGAFNGVLSSLDNYTNGSNDAATVCSDCAGSGIEVDTELRTPTFSLAGVVMPSLSYTANYQNLGNTSTMGGDDFLDVDISTDGGTMWTTLLSWNEDHGSDESKPGEDVTIDLSAYAGLSNLIIRWRHYDPNENDWNWYAQIDEVHIEGVTIPEPGTLALFGLGIAGLGVARRRKATVS